jgi:tetratricopeptide (TPR) repeat protein
LCLDRRRSELRALVDVFARADAATVELASGAVDRLRDPAQCADPSALAAELALAPLPADRSIAAAVWTLRERLAGVRVLESAGRYDEGAQQIAALLDEARALGDASVLAEALLLQAILAGKRTDYPAADRALRAALSEAERAGHHTLRAEAMVYRIELVGHVQARPDAVEDWVDPTLALVRHVAPGSALEGRALVNLGLMRFRQNNFAAAVESQEQAIALLSRVLKEGDPLFIGALRDIGRSYLRAGRQEDSLRALTRARSLAERELGPEHPILIGIYLNLANTDDHSEALYRKSIDLATRTFGPDHASAALAMSNLGLVHASRGDYERALDLFHRSAAINRRVLGVHPASAIPYTNAGDALIQLGRPEEALASLREALAMFDELYPDGHPEALTTLINLGDATRRLGRLEESRDYLRRAREISLKHNTSVAFVAMELADTLTTLGAADEALELLAALDPKVDLGLVFETHREWLHAKALWAASPPDRARAHATMEAVEARLLARIADPKVNDGIRKMSRTQLADVRAWLSEHVRKDRPKRK